jgi:hypothetical protein
MMTTLGLEDLVTQVNDTLPDTPAEPLGLEALVQRASETSPVAPVINEPLSMEALVKRVVEAPSDQVTDPQIDSEKVPLDPGGFFAQKKRRMIDRYSSEFGHAGDDSREPRGEETGWFTSILPPGFGKNTVSDFRNVGNLKDSGLNDADLMLKDLRTLGIEKTRL